MVRGDRFAADTVAVVLAGGQGTRLGTLTRHVCKPALPFAASYRTIDFSLSNCMNSGIRRVGVATQYRPEALIRHLETVWSSAVRRRGEFLEAWPAEIRAPTTGYRGTADAVFRNLDLIGQQHARHVLVLAGDHVYQMDYRPMLEFHRDRQADVTVGSFEVPVEEAGRFGVLTVGNGSRIERFVEKPSTIDGARAGDRVWASMGIYVFDAAFLGRILRRDADSIASCHDFGGDILPGLLGRAALYAYPFQGRRGHGSAYWRDVGTPAAYWKAHLDLLDGTLGLRLDDPSWPIRSAGGRPALVASALPPDGSVGRRSLVAPGCSVAGELQRSVLFSGAKIGTGSVLEDSVVLPGAVVGEGCCLTGTIVGSHCEVPDGMVIDSSGSGGTTRVPDEPVVLTADDFVADKLRAYA